MRRSIPILFTLLLLLPFPWLRSDVARLGPNLFVAGVPTQHFTYFAAPQRGGRQRSANWCWAACIQMVLNYHGVRVTQEQIVRKVYGRLIDRPAGARTIIAALNGWAPSINGRPVYVQAMPYYVNAQTIIRDLTYRWPLIVGLRQQPISHAYVLTAVKYGFNSWRQPVPVSVVLRDPWPGNPSRVELPWTVFASRVMFATRVYVRR